MSYADKCFSCSPTFCDASEKRKLINNLSGGTENNANEDIERILDTRFHHQATAAAVAVAMAATTAAQHTNK